MAEAKPKQPSSLRRPKPKKTLGLSVPSALRMPHEDLIKAEELSTPVTPVTPVTSVTSVTRVIEDVAPKRDFTRTANSIVRDAIPAGVFSGKGKQLYDYLYSKTRGAIVPVRSARLPTGSVMRGAGMTRHTYRAHLQKLVSSGLVQVEEKAGEHGGNVFTVLLPEEIGINPGDRGDRGHTGVTVQDLDMVQGSEIDPCDRGLTSDFPRGYSDSKTSFKTKEEKFDDEAAPRTLREAEREINGEVSGLAAWEPLFQLLTTELKIAAARTTVSSVPAFLTEHLRRRLFKRSADEMRVESRETSQTLPPAKVDASACLDCGGTGWWYPEGAEKGVAKCSHLKQQSVPSEKENPRD